MAEASGILNWMLDGWLMFREEGLKPPLSVLSATDEYREDNDPVGQFLSAATVEDAYSTILAARLYGAYCSYCRANAIRPRSMKWFGGRMTERNFKREKNEASLMLYAGLRLTKETFGEAIADVQYDDAV